MTYHQVAVPAYGRDYKSAAAVQADWLAGKDFRCEPQGCYVNKEDADKAGLTMALRYAKLTKVVIIEAPQ